METLSSAQRSASCIDLLADDIESPPEEAPVIDGPISTKRTKWRAAVRADDWCREAQSIQTLALRDPGGPQTSCHFGILVMMVAVDGFCLTSRDI